MLKAVKPHLFHSLIFSDIMFHQGCIFEAHGSKRDTEWLLIKRCNKANFGSFPCHKGFNVTNFIILVTGGTIDEDFERPFFSCLRFYRPEMATEQR